MTRKGDCWDNAVAESLFATIKNEAFGDYIPPSRDAAKRVIGEYLDVYYNTKRRHSFLNYDSPIKFGPKSQLALKSHKQTVRLAGGGSRDTQSARANMLV